GQSIEARIAGDAHGSARPDSVYIGDGEGCARAELRTARHLFEHECPPVAGEPSGRAVERNLRNAVVPVEDHVTKDASVASADGLEHGPVEARERDIADLSARNAVPTLDGPGAGPAVTEGGRRSGRRAEKHDRGKAQCSLTHG